MKHLLTFLLIAFTCSLYAQSEPHPCGSQPHISKWYKKYVANPHVYKTHDSLVYVPLKIHNVGSDDGGGLFAMDRLLDALCTLNEDFKQAEIQFYILGAIDTIYNSAYNSHASVLDGAEMMFANNVDSAINVYFVSNPAGNCGYNLPYAGIAMNKGCSGPSDHTFAHEVGHNLSVQHPHLGWDGNVYDPNEPTPTTVTYDYTYFKDTLILDTLIIDTSIVELVDGSNCSIAGDFLCDTGPDYLSRRWQCTSDTLSTANQEDPNGQSFRSDASQIMSYALDNCSYRFTPEQIALARANLFDQKSEYLNREEAQEVITEDVVLNEPFMEQIVPAEFVEFLWDDEGIADQYIFELSRLRSFAFTDFDTVLSDNTLTLTDLQLDRRYYWRVRPFSRYSFCTDFSEPSEFITSETTSTAEMDGARYKIFPTVLPGSARINVISESSAIAGLSYSLTTISGLEIAQGVLNQEGKINLDNYASGIYFLTLAQAGSRHVQKIVIQ